MVKRLARRLAAVALLPMAVGVSLFGIAAPAQAAESLTAWQGSCGYINVYFDHAWVTCSANGPYWVLFRGSCGSGDGAYSYWSSPGSGDVTLGIQCYDYATISNVTVQIGRTSST